MNFFIDSIFVLSVKKYSDFSIITALSSKLGKERFVVSNFVMRDGEKFDSGFLLRIKYKAGNNFYKIYDYKSLFHNVESIDCRRLFAVQSLASLIDRFVNNVDDVNFIKRFMSKIISIFYEKNWINLYFQFELKILSIYFDLDSAEILKIKNVIRSEISLSAKRLKYCNINNKVEVFNFGLQKLEELWYNLGDGIVLPKERLTLKRLLINF